MSGDHILYDVSEGIATITLNRPEKMNSVTYPMLHAILDCFDRTDADDDVKAVIVTGAGDRAFCAGADLGAAGDDSFNYKDRADMRDRQMINGVYPDTGGRIALRIFRSLKPVIGAINGVSVGFGASSILPMDVRIAADTARFRYVYTRIGLVPEAASAWFLPRIVGLPTALEWALSGRMIAAQEALDRGLVRSLHPQGELLEAARAVARGFFEGGAPVSIALTRQMLWQAMTVGHPMEAHKVDSRAVAARGASADIREGLAAFGAKRTPDFPDKVSTDMPDFFPWWEEPEFE
jgi:enoyl-CoA hydratase/carnithine racemase